MYMFIKAKIIFQILQVSGNDLYRKRRMCERCVNQVCVNNSVPQAYEDDLIT